MFIIVVQHYTMLKTWFPKPELSETWLPKLSLSNFSLSEFLNNESTTTIIKYLLFQIWKINIYNLAFNSCNSSLDNHLYTCTQTTVMLKWTIDNRKHKWIILNASSLYKLGKDRSFSAGSKALYYPNCSVGITVSPQRDCCVMNFWQRIYQTRYLVKAYQGEKCCTIMLPPFASKVLNNHQRVQRANYPLKPLWPQLPWKTFVNTNNLIA